MEATARPFPSCLFWASAIVLFATGLLMDWLGPMALKIIMPRVWGTSPILNKVWAIALMLTPVGGALPALAISQIPRLGWQLILVVLIWLYFGVAFIVSFSIIFAEEWGIWFSVASSLALNITLSMSLILLPVWFGTQTDDPNACFLLWAFGIIGMVVADLTYAVFIEPLLTRHDQVVLGRIVLIALFVAVITIAAQTFARVLSRRETVEQRPSAVPSFRHYLAWTLLSFATTGLGAATVKFITADVSPTPLLWLVILMFSHLALAVACSQPAQASADPRAVFRGRLVHALAFLPAAFFMLVLFFQLNVWRAENFPFLFVPFIFLVFFVLPYSATLTVQLVLLPMALLVFFFLPADRVSVWFILFILITFWVFARGGLGRMMQFAPPPKYLPHLAVCLYGGQSLVVAHSLILDWISPPWIVEYPLFLLLAAGVRFIPVRELAETTVRPLH